MPNDFFEIIRKRIQASGMSQAQFSRETGVQQGSLSRFLKGEQSSLSGDTVAKIVNFFGAKLVFPGENEEPSRDVCFVNTRIMPAGEYVAPPVAEDYLAAPLVGEVGAGLGYIPQDVIEGWCLVSRNNPAVRSRSNLIAVEIGHSSYSMQPTLNPGDIVLVDKNDRNIQHCGHIMLVTDPEGAGMIKRVAINDKKDDDYRIIFYSDNNLQHPPLVYSLRNDYAGDWDKVVAGRVILALTDMRKK